ncbi:MAG TPA: hypothetical protein VJU80_01060 [Solirubrobacteraceae bacterium]|nr:hypothetical protein [Solirubrobacteraceae bacterium]
MSPGQRAYLFREVNDRIYELLESGEPDLPGEFLCECGRDCGRRVLLLPEVFAALRRKGDAVRSAACREPKSSRGRRKTRLAGGVPALD